MAPRLPTTPADGPSRRKCRIPRNLRCHRHLREVPREAKRHQDGPKRRLGAVHILPNLSVSSCDLALAPGQKPQQAENHPQEAAPDTRAQIGTVQPRDGVRVREDKVALRGPKMSKNGPKTAQDGPKMAPRRFQDDAKMDKMALSCKRDANFAKSAMHRLSSAVVTLK